MGSRSSAAVNRLQSVVPGTLTTLPPGLIQRITCRQEYGAPGATPTNQLTRDKEQARQRLDINLNSWDAYLIDQLRTIANDLFATEAEVAWWGNWAVGAVVGILDEAIPKPIGAVITAIASAGEHIASQSIAAARARLGQAAVDAAINERTRIRRDGTAYIDGYFERIRGRDEECAGYLEPLIDSINQWWPMLDATALPTARRLANRLMEAVRQAELTERLRQEYEDCVRMALYRPGGVPSAEEEAAARAECQRRTGYLPPGAC